MQTFQWSVNSSVVYGINLQLVNATCVGPAVEYHWSKAEGNTAEAMRQRPGIVVQSSTQKRSAGPEIRKPGRRPNYDDTIRNQMPPSTILRAIASASISRVPWAILRLA